MRKRPIRPIDKDIFPTAESPSLDVTALDTPERVLAYCREKGFIDGSSTDIEKLIEDNPKLTLEYEELGENDAYIQETGDNQYRIVINSGHPKKRQKFSMAHEYVHYQNHRSDIKKKPRGEKILHRSEERNRIERLANQCAAEILMPEEVFMRVVQEKNGNISEVADDFGVSQLAVRYRAKSLEIEGHGL